MKRQGGFTLIELVVVIVILGILAVTAAPKFMNLQGDARKASLQGLKGAIEGAAGITYGRSAIEGIESQSSATTTQGDIPVAYGYPQATSAALGKVVNGLTADWKMVKATAGTANNPGSIIYTYKGNKSEDKCVVTYTAAQNTDTPASTVITLGPDCAE